MKKIHIFYAIPFLFILSTLLSTSIALKSFQTENKIIKNKYIKNLTLSSLGKKLSISELQNQYLEKNINFKDNFEISNLSSELEFEINTKNNKTEFIDVDKKIKNLSIRIFNKKRQFENLWFITNVSLEFENKNNTELEIASETKKIIGASLKKGKNILLASELIEQNKDLKNSKELKKYFQLNLSSPFSLNIDYDVFLSESVTADDYNGSLKNVVFKIFFKEKPDIFQHIEFSVEGFKKIINLKLLVDQVEEITPSQIGTNTLPSFIFSNKQEQIENYFSIKKDSEFSDDVGITFIKSSSENDYDDESGTINNIQIRLFQKSYTKNTYDIKKLQNISGFKKKGV